MMIRGSARRLSRYAPYAMAVQSRFKWRHRESDPWRRLMDASCFMVDWITRPRGADLSQYGGHWSHIVTCSHVLCPWNYPNFYPPVGVTRYVSKITLPDTMTQIRMPSLQGEIVYRHFTSNFHVYTHTNPRLDIAVTHPEQNFKRSGEMKMLWLQNEGYVQRPRFEVLDDVKVGDTVWIHGMAARSDVFDEEAPIEPLMIPTGVKGRVKHLAAENFFVEVDLDGQPDITMGMCGSPVIRDGKLVGMLTATVHGESPNEFLRNTAMCAYGRDIRAFLMEVEKQMKNAVMPAYTDPSQFMTRRHQEGRPPPEHKDWSLVHTRLANHVEVPSSLWKMEQDWMQDEDKMSSGVFGRSGPFSAEVQEQLFGMDMNQATHDGRKPEGVQSATSDGGSAVEEGMRPDPSPSNIYGPEEDFKTKSVWDTDMTKDIKQNMSDTVKEGELDTMDKLRRSVESINAKRLEEKIREASVDGGVAQKKAKDNIEAARIERELRAKKRPYGGDDDISGIWGRH